MSKSKTIQFDHIGLRVTDLAKARTLYAALLAPLGLVELTAGGFGPEGGEPTLWLVEDARGGGAHVAFAAPHRDAVAAFHAAGVQAGATDHGKPGLRADYSPTYYAAFVLDPDGNNLEAVITK